MATWADIQSWDHNAIIEAEDLIEAEVREAREIIADLEHAANDIRSQGEAPDRMRERLSEIQDKLDARLNELTEYALATAELHGYVSRVVAKRKSAWEVAAEVGYDIPESGVVQPSAPETRFEPIASKFAELRDCVDDAVRIATEAEETVGPRYQALADGQYVLAEGRHSASAGLANDADPSWSPEEVSVWWALLSESEREALINKDPEKYGNLNGIDMASRVKANELALNGHRDAAGNRIPGLLEKAQKEYDEAKAAYEKDRDSFWGNPYKVDASLERYRNAENKLNDLLAVKKALEGEDISLVALEFGERGENVRAALAIGDVDNAKHVTTFVPGMTTSCRKSTDLNLGYARNLIDAAETVGGAEKGSVAAVAWMGYEAPPGPETGDLSVASPGKAQAGAEKLNGFLTGIHSWRSERGMDVHQTPVTHSYGSLTGGFAMRDIGEGVVDDFVYTGSPGSAVNSVGTLGVDPEHTWVSAIPLHDEVQGMGLDVNFGRDPKELEGIGHLSGDATGGDGYNSDPNAEKYANHSAYFYKAKAGQHNYSLEDIGEVIAGKKKRL
ncbi:alpha/beta hydrolase [Schaalia sp. ORNL0103]|uniref:alpha/beta hydrolase n=1 Tax=Schaalia sp. ORNL0103 TaxID=2789426 RepID=UPI001CA35A0B|nr:alpha/beta hydrolase [Schaalia sp. ORNL0103]MBW6413430.1 alpha/beta hydrolase family protein [Schaalia sp. ORNL0103]